MTSKIILVLIVVTVTVAAVPPPTAGMNWPQVGVNSWIPAWVAAMPWLPQWTSCTEIGTTCLDCSTKMICTKIGGMQKACTDPSMPYCNLGKCSATPTPECTPLTTSQVPDTSIAA